MPFEIIQCLECDCHFFRKTVGHICDKCLGETDDQHRKSNAPAEVIYVASSHGRIRRDTTVAHGYAT